MKLATAIMSLTLLTLFLLSTTAATPFSSSSLQTMDQSTKTLNTGLVAADDLLKRHIYYLDCGVLRGYCNRAGYYCDGNGLLAYQYEEDTICNMNCHCGSMNQPPRPSPPRPSPLSISLPPVIVSVVPCPKNMFWDNCIDEVDGRVVKYTGEIATSTKSLNTVVATPKPPNIEVKPTVDPTKPFDMEVTAPATLSKRHSYALICGGMQTFCSQNGYFCDGHGHVRRRFNRLRACDQACICRSLAPKPLVITVVPCPKGSIFDLCKEVDGKVVENTGTVGDAVESGEVESIKTLGDAVESNETVSSEEQKG